jgi:DnaJ family protein C protein 12
MRITFHPQVEQITTEYKIRALSCHPDKHPDDVEAEDKFKCLQEAKNILTDPESRRNYDKWLNSGINVSFESWLAMNRKGQAFHWVKQSVTKQMIQSKDQTGEESSTRWQRQEGNDTLSKFRNYQI